MKNNKELLDRLSIAEQEIKTVRQLMSKVSVMDRIKTVQDAFDELGWDIKNPPKWENYLTAIARALNEGWEPNWDDSSEQKWYPYFDMRAGFGFSATTYVYWYAYTSVGPRLCFKSKELAEYAGRQFVKEYKEWMTL